MNTDTPVRLHAVTERGLLPVDPPPNATGLHDAFDDQPPGVYSGLRTFAHVRFLRLDLHLARTHRSTLASGWEDFDEPLLRRALHEAACASLLPDARVRFDVYAEPVSFGPAQSRMLIGFAPLAPVPEQFLRLGVHAQVARALARERPRVKTTDFVQRRRPFPLGTREAYEHLMLDGSGRILEGTSSNFFGVQSGALRTAGSGVLEGVTRAILLELAAGLEIPARLEPISLSELNQLDEAFLTSSSRALVPIVEIDGARIGAGRPGPMFRRLLDAYLAYAEREARPAVE